MNQFNSNNNLTVQSSDCYQNLNIPMDYDDLDQDCQKSPTTTNISSTLLNIPTLVIQNVVSTVSLGTRLDLQKIALYTRNTEYNSSRFAPVIVRIREPRTTALTFSSGKIACAGAKLEETSRQASRKYAKIVQSLGFETKLTDFKIHNMVATCDLNITGAKNLEDIDNAYH